MESQTFFMNQAIGLPIQQELIEYLSISSLLVGYVFWDLEIK